MQSSTCDVLQRLLALKQAAQAKGADMATSDKISQFQMYRMVKRQAGILAYNRIFFIMGLAFLVIIPFLLLLKKPRHH